MDTYPGNSLRFICGHTQINAKDAKKPNFAEDYSLKRQERKKARRRKKKSTSTRPGSPDRPARAFSIRCRKSAA